MPFGTTLYMLCMLISVTAFIRLAYLSNRVRRKSTESLRFSRAAARMTSCFENMQMPSCVWFEGGEKRNALVSMLAGTLFFVGWWFIIDAHAKYPDEMSNAYHVCGVFGTISLFMVNSVTNAQIRGEAYNGGCLGARGARSWLFIGFVMGFAAVIAACWILFANFVAAGAPHHWPGVGLFLQNIFIFLGSLTYKFGRSEDQWG